MNGRKKIYPFAVTAHGLSSNSMAEFSHQIYFAMQYVFSNWGMCFILSSQFKWFATKPRFPLGWIIVFPSPFSTWKRSRLRKKIMISHVFRGQVLISTGSLDRGTKISRVRTRLDSAVFCRLSVFKCFVPYYTQPTRQKLPKIDIAYFVSLSPILWLSRWETRREMLACPYNLETKLVHNAHALENNAHIPK